MAPENGPADARSDNYGPCECKAAEFYTRDEAAINAAPVRFRHLGRMPPSAALYIGVVDEVGRLLTVFSAPRNEPDASGDIVFYAGTIRMVRG